MTQTARSQTPHHHFTGDTKTTSSGQKTRRARRYCAILLTDVRAALLAYLHHCSALLLLPQTRTWPGSGGKKLSSKRPLGRTNRTLLHVSGVSCVRDRASELLLLLLLPCARFSSLENAAFLQLVLLLSQLRALRSQQAERRCCWCCCSLFLPAASADVAHSRARACALTRTRAHHAHTTQTSVQDRQNKRSMQAKSVARTIVIYCYLFVQCFHF